jgi:opacity protein-like surface antigen
VWLRAQVRGGLPLKRLNEQLDLQLVVPLGFGWTRSEGAFSSMSTAYGVDLVPLARLGLSGPTRLRFYGDVGVGVVHYRYRFEIPSLGGANGHSTGLGIRVGAGVEYALTPQVALFFEPIHLLFQTAQEGTFRFGNTSYTSSTGAGTQAQLSAGAQMRF